MKPVKIMIRKRPSAGLRLQLMLPLLALTIGSTWAQAEKAENKGKCNVDLRHQATVMWIKGKNNNDDKRPLVAVGME